MAGALDGAAPFVPWIWMVGVMLFLLRLNVGLVAAGRMTTVGTEVVEGELAWRFEEMKARMGVGGVVRLLETARVEVPTVIGWMRPVVLMPLGCLAGMGTAQVEALLAHELAHIRRHDYLVNVLQTVVEAVLFYHPAVWWVSKQVRLERECRCDALAVEAGGDALGYARALSFLASRRAGLPELAVGANGGVLTMRIKRLLGYRESSVGTQGAALALLAVLMVVPGGYLARAAWAERAPVGAARALQPVELVGSVTVGEVRPVAAAALSVARVDVPSGQETKPLTVSGGVMAGQVVEKVDPVYPEIAKAARVQGAVVLEAAISKEGRVTGLRVVSGPEMLRASAMDAVRQWVYQPYRLNGDARAVTTTVTVNYHLASGADGAAGEGSVWLNEAQMRTVPAGLMAGQLVRKVDPVYPAEAKAAHLQGAVVMRVVISKEGRVKGIDLMSQPSALTQSALDAVRQWVYQPYQLNGEPMEVQTTVTVNFSLEDTGGGAASSPGASGSSGASAGGPKRIMAGVMAGQLVSHKNPVYPAEARAKHIEGTVVMRAVISKEGTVENLTVLSGPEELRQGAVDAVSQWVYRPYLLNGEPTEVDTTITVNFTMGGGPVVKRVGNGVSAPVLVHMEDPVYSEEARTKKISGNVLVNLIVDENGNPSNVRVVRGVGYGLDAKAVDAVKSYKFKPAKEDGRAVAVQLALEVNFQVF